MSSSEGYATSLVSEKGFVASFPPHGISHGAALQVPHVGVPVEGITIVFGKAIRMSANSLIARADKLIVMKATIRTEGICG